MVVEAGNAINSRHFCPRKSDVAHRGREAKHDEILRGLVGFRTRPFGHSPRNSSRRGHANQPLYGGIKSLMKLSHLTLIILQLFERYDITVANLHSNQHKTSTKRSVIETAQHWLLYFARIFPISVSYKRCEISRYKKSSLQVCARNESILTRMRYRERGKPQVYYCDFKLEEIEYSNSICTNGNA